MTGKTYIVDINHSAAQDSSNHGNLDQPWRTLNYAFQRLEPGDTLLVRAGTYTDNYMHLGPQNSGQEGAPITIKAFESEQPVIKGGTIDLEGVNWWTFEGLTFDAQVSAAMIMGRHQNLKHDKTVSSEHITIRKCEFKDGKRSSLSMHYVNHILVEDSYFHHVRPGVPFRDGGWEVVGIDARYIVDNMIVRNNRFEDIGSDGVHLGAVAYKSGSYVGKVDIVDNHFWVNRPYTGILGNVGENGIDVKDASGPVLIARNTVHGFRRTTPEQDASGDPGAGIMVHERSRNVIIEKNLVYDNVINLVVGGNSSDIVVRNNVLKHARKTDRPSNGFVGGHGLEVGNASNVRIYHNTIYDNDHYLSGWNVTNSFFQNNVICKGGSSVDSNSQIWRSDYNVWSQVTGGVPTSLTGPNDLQVGDPMLDDELHPLSDSPLIDKALPGWAVEDFYGTPRSDEVVTFGAFEYVKTSTKPVEEDEPTDEEPTDEEPTDEERKEEDLEIFLQHFPLSFSVKVRIDGPDAQPVIVLESGSGVTIEVPPAPKEGLININEASITELTSLPGIGPKTAELIVATRPFATIEDITRVKGIGEITLGMIRYFITVKTDEEGTTRSIAVTRSVHDGPLNRSREVSTLIREVEWKIQKYLDVMYR